MFNKLKELFNLISNSHTHIKIHTENTYKDHKENISTTHNEGSSKIVVTEFPLSNFESLYNNTSIDIIVSPDSKDSDTKAVMRLTCSEDYLKLINIESKNDLKISYNKDTVVISHGKKQPTLEVPASFIENIYNNSLGNMTIESGVTVSNSINNKSSGDIHVANFIGNKLINNGLGNISIDVLTSDYVHIESKSSGNIHVEDANINELDCRLNGLGNITIIGSIIDAHIKSTSSGNINIEHIQASAKIDLSGLGDVKIKGTMFDSLSITSSSSGTVEVERLDTEELIVNTKGLGDVKISEGGAVQVKMESSSSGDIKCPHLICVNSHITLNSLGDISFIPTKTLEAYSKGSGDIKLNGNSVLDIAQVHINSLGEIKTDNVEAIELVMFGDRDSCQIQQNAGYKSLHKTKMK